MIETSFGLDHFRKERWETYDQKAKNYAITMLVLDIFGFVPGVGLVQSWLYVNRDEKGFFASYSSDMLDGLPEECTYVSEKARKTRVLRNVGNCFCLGPVFLLADLVKIFFSAITRCAQKKNKG